MKKYKSKFNENEEFNGRRIDGVVFSAKSLDILLKEGLIDFMMDLGHDAGFSPLDIVEMHVYNPYDSIEGVSKLSDLNYPSAEVKGNLIYLESAFGFGKEDQIICKRVKIIL